MILANYKTKKELKENICEYLRYTETSYSGAEYVSTGKFAVVGPSPLVRKWYATVHMQDDIIMKVE